MVLDDAWEVAHCEQLAFIDDSTQSKLLVSSRVKGVLEGGSIVDLNLPSDYDAQKMLLNEAGLDADPSDAPPEAAEVTKFCNNLPLAVGMAGRLLKTMSLTIDDDWSGVVAVLKSEFGEGGQARSMENSIIRTSLKSVRGSQHDEVVQLFHAFALVPEDTVCASSPFLILAFPFPREGLQTNDSFSPPSFLPALLPFLLFAERVLEWCYQINKQVRLRLLALCLQQRGLFFKKASLGGCKQSHQD